MKRVEGWQTTDGKLFTDEADARQNQNKLDFAKWYDDSYYNGLFYESEQSVPCDRLVSFLIKRKEQILKLLSE